MSSGGSSSKHTQSSVSPCHFSRQGCSAHIVRELYHRGALRASSRAPLRALHASPNFPIASNSPIPVFRNIPAATSRRNDEKAQSRAGGRLHDARRNALSLSAPHELRASRARRPWQDVALGAAAISGLKPQVRRLGALVGRPGPCKNQCGRLYSPLRHLIFRGLWA
jgi:hypothetical protein